MEFPFLYQTRTILCLGRASAHFSRSSPRRACTSTPLRSLSTQQSRDVDWKGRYFKRIEERNRRAETGEPETEPTDEIPVQRSTITVAEQRNFAYLEELAHRHLSADQSPEPERLSTDPGKILALFPGPSQRWSEPVAEDLNDSTFDSLAKQGQQQLDDIATKQPATSHDDLIAKICHHQLRKYHRIFLDDLKVTEQPTDLSVFESLKTHVFPLVDLIPLSSKDKTSFSSKPGQPPNTIKQPETKELSKSSLASILPLSEIINTVSPTTRVPPKIPGLSIISRLYPAATLLALRLLTKHCPLSPITSSLLPEIRRLGATSYVLAANTHFYNTFLLLRWSLYSSLSEICSLLGEMERGAVGFDKDTASFLADLAEERARDLYMARSPYSDEEGGGEEEVKRAANWWRKSEQAKWWPRVAEWRSIIAKRLEEKGVGEVVREGPYSALLADEALNGAMMESSRREVWL